MNAGLVARVYTLLNQPEFVVLDAALDAGLDGAHFHWNLAPQFEIAFETSAAGGLFRLAYVGPLDWRIEDEFGEHPYDVAVVSAGARCQVVKILLDQGLGRQVVMTERVRVLLRSDREHARLTAALDDPANGRYVESWPC
jgi:hypothetical protein